MTNSRGIADPDIRVAPDEHGTRELLHHTILMVEVNGIEPMTSCLQSRRSPN